MTKCKNRRCKQVRHCLLNICKQVVNSVTEIASLSNLHNFPCLQEIIPTIKPPLHSQIPSLSSTAAHFPKPTVHKPSQLPLVSLQQLPFTPKQPSLTANQPLVNGVLKHTKRYFQKIGAVSEADSPIGGLLWRNGPSGCTSRYWV